MLSVQRQFHMRRKKQNRYGGAARGTHGWVVELHDKDQCQAGGAAMKQLEVGDRVKILDGGKDDEDRAGRGNLDKAVSGVSA